MDRADHQEPDQQYTYDAFISYRHVERDRKWAEWLIAGLEAYRVPQSLQDKGYPARLRRNAMNVAPEAEDDFNAWYDEEHLVALARVPGTLAARRYRSTEAGGGTHRYVAIYHLASPDVARSAAWKAAADTPWSARVRPHFRDRIRILTRRYVRGG
jgi:hypothetical protein